MDINILRQKVQEEKAKLETAKANGSEIDVKIIQNTLKFLGTMIFEIVQSDETVRQLIAAKETERQYQKALDDIRLSIETLAVSSENALAFNEVVDFL